MSRFTRIAVLCGLSLFAASACGSDDESSDVSTAGSILTGSAVSTETPVASDATNASAPTDATTPTVSAPATEATPVPSAETGPATDAVDTSTTTDTDLGDAGTDGVYSVEAANGTVTLDGQPVKIVSLSPTHTEMLFAIGAGDQVIAVDDQSDYPPEAESVMTDLSGFTPNVEAIAGYEPDLVVIADDFNGLGEQLAAVDIPVWSGPTAASLDDAYSQLEQLGVLTGHLADAAEVVANIDADIDEILAEVPETEVPLTYYHELDPTYFSVTSNTFIGQIYSLAGLQNIADAAEPPSDYPQLSSELIVSSNPDLIFLADTKCCAETAETVAARDGWSTIPAVVNGAVIEMDDDIASRWGPRVVDYLRAVVDAVAAVPAVAPG